MLQKVFKLNEKKSNVKTEIIAGITTFLTMAYILGVNPQLLSLTGMDVNSVFLATAISSAIACFLMGVLANYPVALAPGMGVNAFFTYTACLTMNFTPAEALAAVFVSGIIFVIISVTGIRKLVINSIPKNLKLAIGAGIGFFIAFIGLSNAGIVVANSATKIGLGDFSNPTVLLGIFGIFVTIGLLARKVNAAVFFGMVITAVVGIVLGALNVDGMPQLPTQLISFEFNMSTAGLFWQGMSGLFGHAKFIVVIFTFLFIDFFDTAGTLVAVGNKIGLVDENGEMENVEKALLADSLGTMVGAALGTSTVTSYVESGSGVAAGGRTGLTAVTTGFLFLLSIVFLPLLSVVNSIPVTLQDVTIFVSPVTSPALVVVGILMAQQLKEIEWEKLEVAAPCFMTIVTMILAYSIADGIAVGFITYGVTSLFSGNAKNVKWISWLLILIFVAYFAFLK